MRSAYSDISVAAVDPGPCEVSGVRTEAEYRCRYGVQDSTVFGFALDGAADVGVQGRDDSLGGDGLSSGGDAIDDLRQVGVAAAVPDRRVRCARR